MARKKGKKRAKKKGGRQQICSTVCRDAKGRFQDAHRCRS